MEYLNESRESSNSYLIVMRKVSAIRNRVSPFSHAVHMVMLEDNVWEHMA